MLRQLTDVNRVLWLWAIFDYSITTKHHTFLCFLHIYCLLNDAVSGSDCMESKDGIIVGKEFERLRKLLLPSQWWDWGKLGGTSGRSVSRSRIELAIFRLQNGMLTDLEFCVIVSKSFYSINIVIFNPLNADLNPICHLLALLGAHLIFHVSGLRVNVFKQHAFSCFMNQEIYLLRKRTKEFSGSLVNGS